MNWLLLDTCCPRAVVVLSVDNKVCAHRYLTDTRAHSEMLSPCVDELLAECGKTYHDLSGVVVGTGPGSFIGSRIALAYAKGLCVALDIPLVGIGTLTCFAHEPQLRQGIGYAVIDARRAEFYAQKFSRAKVVIELEAPRLVPAAQIDQMVAESDFVAGLPSGIGPSAEGLHAAFLGLENLVDSKLTLVPQYVRDPDAKPMIVPES